MIMLREWKDNGRKTWQNTYLIKDHIQDIQEHLKFSSKKVDNMVKKWAHDLDTSPKKT